VLVLGVGAGAHGARAILTYLDSPHRTPIVSRTVRRAPGQSLSTTIATGVDAIHSIAATMSLPVQFSAIAYRVATDPGSVATRGTARTASLVPETAAQVRYLRFIGLVPNHGVTVLCDIGSTGTTVTVIDLASTRTLMTRRTATFCGDDLDHSVRRLLSSNGVRVGIDASRSIKEQLSVDSVVSTTDESGAARHVLTRRDFDDLNAGTVRYAGMLVEQTIELSGARPQSIVVVGGGANITSIARSLELRTGLTTLVPTMPELVSARGAALLSPDR